MKPSYTEFDPIKRITSTKNQKPIRIANIISNYFLEAFVFNNSDVYNSILNKMNKNIKFETTLYRIKCFKTYSGRPKIKNNYRKPIEIAHQWGLYALMEFVFNKSSEFISILSTLN